MKKSDTIKRFVIQYIAPLLLLFAGAAIVTSFGKREVASNDSNGLDDTPVVHVTNIDAYNAAVIVEADGLVVPFREIQLATQVSGIVLEKSEDCRAGNEVIKGQELFKIDPTDYEIELRRCETQLDQSKIELDELSLDIDNTAKLLELALADSELQQKEVDRLEEIATKVVIPQSDIDRAKRAFLSSEQNRQQLDNQQRSLAQKRYRLSNAVKLSEIQLERARLDLERTNITSTVSGRIVREVVEQDSFAQKGSTLVVIQDRSRAEVRCKIRISDLEWITGERVDVDQSGASLGNLEVKVVYTPENTHDECIWTGRLERFDGEGVESDTHLLPVRVVIDEPVRTDDNPGPRRIVRGMYVTVRITGKKQANLVKVPASALRLNTRTSHRLWRIDGKVPAKSGSKEMFSGELQKITGFRLIRPVIDAETGDRDSWIVDPADSDLKSGDTITISNPQGYPKGLQPGMIVDYVVQQQLLESVEPEVPAENEQGGADE